MESNPISQAYATTATPRQSITYFSLSNSDYRQDDMLECVETSLYCSSVNSCIPV